MKKALIILLAVIWIIPGLRSQSVLDSALYQRNSIYSDYHQFQQSIESRTWINMVNLTTKAQEVIKSDNTIINYHLYNLLKENESQIDRINQLNSEILLLKKEADVQKLILEERRFLYNTLFIIIATLSLLFLIILILYINRQIGYQGLKNEIRYLYAAQGDDSSEKNDNQKLVMLNGEIDELKIDKQKLVSKINILSESLQRKEKELEAEANSKLQVEEQIRKLIKQIKAYQ